MKVLAGEHNQHLAAKRQIFLSCEKYRAIVKVNIGLVFACCKVTLRSLPVPVCWLVANYR